MGKILEVATEGAIIGGILGAAAGTLIAIFCWGMDS